MLTVQELIDKLNKVSDKSRLVYVDIYNDKQDTVLEVFNVDDMAPVGNNINITTYKDF